MNRLTVLLTAFLTLVLLAAGCSRDGAGPIDPALNQPTAQELTPGTMRPGETETHLWGYYDVGFDIDRQTMEAVVNRSAAFATNVVAFLNDNPAGLDFEIIDTPKGPGYTDVDVRISITHPLPGHPEYHGYDIRGVFIGDGTETLGYNNDLRYAAPGVSQSLMNADGYTRWFNPGEFTTPGEFGYTPGAFASPGYTGTATLNAYKYFADGLGPATDLWDFLTTTTQHGVFKSGSTNTRDYHLRFPDAKDIVYGYAIVANWEAEDVHPANAPEAVACEVTDCWKQPAQSLILDISLFAWDHQPSRIFIESTVLDSVYEFTAGDMIPVGIGDHYATYHVEIPADSVPGPDDNELWVVAQYDGFDYTNEYGVPNLAAGDRLASLFRFELHINPDCPIPNITGIDPDHGWVDQNPCDVMVYCDFTDGPSLSVRMEKLGKADILGTIIDKDEAAGWILCRFDLTGADWNGKWNVVVNNGCDMPGELTNAFQARTCVAEKQCPTGTVDDTYQIAYNNGWPYLPEHGGHTMTRAAYPPYIIVCGQTSNAPAGEKFQAITTSGVLSYTSGPIHGAYYWPTSFVMDSNDRLYYNSHFDYRRIEYVDLETAGFGPMDNLLGTLPSPWQSWRITVDDLDNPIVLAVDSGPDPDQLGIFRWNGTDFGDAIIVDSEVVSYNGGSAYVAANDFDYNPGTGHYLITNRSQGVNYPTLYAIDANGDVADKDQGMWSVAGQTWTLGIHIDKDDPECRMMLSCAAEFGTGTKYRQFFARYNLGYGERETGSGSSADSSRIFETFYDNSRGVVLKDGNSYYYYGFVQRLGNNYVLGRIELPQW
jgi:hypothetical protein